MCSILRLLQLTAKSLIQHMQCLFNWPFLELLHTGPGPAKGNLCEKHQWGKITHWTSCFVDALLTCVCLWPFQPQPRPCENKCAFHYDMVRIRIVCHSRKLRLCQIKEWLMFHRMLLVTLLIACFKSFNLIIRWAFRLINDADLVHWLDACIVLALNLNSCKFCDWYFVIR